MSERRIETTVDIDAPPSRVWALLTDFARMGAWNPFITAISGDLAPGATLSVQVSPPGKGTMRFTPVVLTVRPERELRWRGKLLLPGLFDGEHYFLLEPLGADRTRLLHGENFSGLLVGPLAGMLPATEQGFAAMNAALAREAQD